MTHYIHYAVTNRLPEERWRDAPCKIIVRAVKGPRNVLVLTSQGMVVVPGRNIRRFQA